MGRRLFFISAACIVLPAMLTGCSSSKKSVHHATVVRKPATAAKVALNNGFPVRKVSSYSADLNKNILLTSPVPKTNMSAGEISIVTPAAQGGVSINKPTTPPADTLRSIQVQSQAPAAHADVAIQDAAPRNTNPAPVIETQEAAIVAAPAISQPTDPLLGKYASMVNVDAKYIGNPQLYRFIDEWYGTEYKWGGEDNTGIDCSAFSQKLYDEVYNVGLRRTSKQQHRESDRFKHIEDAMQGDLVFFRVRRFRISHVGVYLANGYFVHASSSQGVVISNLNDRYWHRRYAGCGRVEKDNSPASESQFTP